MNSALIDDTESAIIDALCERRGIDKCTLPHCKCSKIARKLVAPLRAALAQGIEARRGETEGLDAKRESPVPEGHAP